MEMLFVQSSASDAGAGLVVFILLLGVGLLVYFIPAIVARHKRSFAPVMAINFFLGWTIVGWVVALAWALKDDPPPQQVIVQTPPMLCPKCGKYSTPGTRFCGECGNGLMAPQS